MGIEIIEGDRQTNGEPSMIIMKYVRDARFLNEWMDGFWCFNMRENEDDGEGEDMG